MKVDYPFTYRDSNGYILKEGFGSTGRIAMTTLISPAGPVFSTIYNPNGSIGKREIFKPFGLKKLTTIYYSDENITFIVQDASLPSDNTLTFMRDRQVA